MKIRERTNEKERSTGQFWWPLVERQQARGCYQSRKELHASFIANEHCSCWIVRVRSCLPGGKDERNQILFQIVSYRSDCAFSALCFSIHFKKSGTSLQGNIPF